MSKISYIEVDINGDSYIVLGDSETKAKEIIAKSLKMKYTDEDMLISITDGEDKTIDEILEYWGATILEVPSNSMFINGYLYDEDGKIIN